MKINVHFFAILFSLVFSLSVSAQENVKRSPRSFSENALSQYIPLMELPQLNREELLTEDEESMKMGNPLRMGVMQPTGFSIDNSGTLDVLNDGTRIWRLRVVSPGAFGVEVNFSNVTIPEGAGIFLYNPDRSVLLGQYTHADVDEKGNLYADEVRGEEVIVEYNEPPYTAFRGAFLISNVGHIYRANLTPEKGNWGNSEGTCHINVACSEGDAWRDQIKSAVYIRMTTSSGIYMCSGSVLNHLRDDKKLFVLTAHHCDQGTNVFRFYFGYQASSCNSSTGSDGHMVLGGVIRAGESKETSSDFMLVEITGNVSEDIKSDLFLAGWDRRSIKPSVGACIHFPGGDFKKISIPSSTSVSYAGYLSRQWIVYWRLGINNKGVTERGSSGSPLFDAQKRVVGQLFGGQSKCLDQGNPDYYGKFSYSWANNGVATNSLKYWLDPNNTGTEYLDGVYYKNATNRINPYESNYKELEVFPNPTSGLLKINGDFQGEKLTYHVVDLLGKVVHDGSFAIGSEYYMNLAPLQGGVYIVELKDSKYTYKAKVIIAK